MPRKRKRAAWGSLTQLDSTTWRIRFWSSGPDGYKRRSLVLGKAINILAPGRDPVPAEVLDLEEDYALLVRLPDGSTTRLNSGEVSIRVDDQH